MREKECECGQLEHRVNTTMIEMVVVDWLRNTIHDAYKNTFPGLF